MESVVGSSVGRRERSAETTPSDRLRRLVEVGIALSSELSLEALLRRLIETAVELTGARYGALGVIDRLGTGLEQFITVGIDDETQATIGDLPRGRGILGVLIRERERAAARATSPRTRARSASRRATRRWRSFLGVPILLRGTAFGNLYLTEKAGGEAFTRRGRGDRPPARRAGGRRDRERAPLRVGAAVVAAARVAERGLGGARHRGRLSPAPRARGGAPARAARRPRRADRSCRPRRRSAHGRGGERRERGRAARAPARRARSKAGRTLARQAQRSGSTR